MIRKYNSRLSLIQRYAASRQGTRLLYLVAIILTMLLGLASRRYVSLLPHWLAVHAGDALWAAMIYWGIRLLSWPRSCWVAGIGAGVFSYLIEFSQLYQADWINHIRHTTLGALILGKGFLVADLLRYTAGIGIAMALDVVINWVCQSANIIHRQER
ncbi:DUF2809 domain-containing protein [Paenibacillus bovis]|uniref:DUF2809 domain-containing protein n=1 Tax=Paenibacillus bovis TaxID=1616788 RepID=A0A172ZH65_9BACL|nr:DUF2809 domain-containing protein [Paenibacillus bovis]ANF96627.1 hypothetical protein AR543_11825 [Paenibacillus bovis]